MEIVKTETPFSFYTRMHLSELTGLRASTLAELVSLIKEVPDSCIYHHTHRFLQQHLYLSPEPPNDFAYWVSETLGEDELGEKLASIDTIAFSDIPSLRAEIVQTIENHLQEHKSAERRFASEYEEFFFVKTVSFIIPTNYAAFDLLQFKDILRKVTIDSIYFHIFESRLRLARGDNDFSHWFETSIGDKELADEISKLDPYTYTLEELRRTIIKKIDARIGNNGKNR